MSRDAYDPVLVDGNELAALTAAVNRLGERIEKLTAGKNDEPLLLSKHSAARLLGISPRTVEGYMYSGALESRLIGGRRLVPAAALRRFAANDRPQISRRPHLAPLPDKPESLVARGGDAA